MNMKMISIILLALSFVATPCFAYIPKLQTITNKVTRSRGEKPIKVVQDILVKDQLTGVSYSVRETLYIKNGDEIKIQVSGKDLLANQVSTSFLYKGQSRFTVNGNSLSSSKTPASFYAPLLYSRTPGGFKKYLQFYNILPPQPDVSIRMPSQENGAKYMKDPNTHLARSSGEVSYALTRQPSMSGNINPTLWVSANNFKVNKIRINDKGVIKLLDYKSYGKKLYHPSEQVIQWQNYTYYINTVSVTSISNNQAIKELNQNTLLSVSNSKDFKSDALETFYTVFR